MCLQPSLPWEDVTLTTKNFTNLQAYNIYAAIRTTKLSWSVAAKRLSEILQIDIPPGALSAACTNVKAKRLRLHKSQGFGPIMDSYLAEPFQYVLSLSPLCPKVKPKRKPRSSGVSRDLFVMMSPEKKLRTEVQEGAYQSLLIDYKKLQLENDELKADHQKVQAENSKLQSELQTLDTTSSDKNCRRPRSSSHSRPAQEITRQHERAEKWRGQYMELQKTFSRTRKALAHIDELKKSNRKLRSLVTSQRSYYKKKLAAMEDSGIAEELHEACEKKEQELKERVSVLEDEINIYKLQTETETEKVLSTKEGHMYNASMRRSIYHALEHQCPIDHAASLVESVAQEFTGQKLESTPCPSTVAKMAREMGTLADIQSGEALFSAENCCIAWDATELSGAHINEVHVATPVTTDGSKRDYYTLSVAQLPGGTTSDYTGHITQSLEQSADTFSGWRSLDPQHVLETVKSNITCTISDRVVVNHCVVQQLLKTLNPALLELFCNLHPLDTLASKARSTLKNTGVTGSSYGRDCAAANVIMNLSKLRYKNGKGDPVAFKSFFKSEGIPLKLFPRYVGNRLHIIFHLAGIHFYLQETVRFFLSKRCAPRGGLTAAVLKDLQNPQILLHLQILGLLGKIITGPWMDLFYTEDSENLEMSTHLRTSVASLEHLEVNPPSLFTATEDVFGRPLKAGDDPVLSALLAAGPGPDTDSVDTVKSIAAVFVEVCKRQLAKYLTTEFTEEEKCQARAAPTHNMQAERVMAMTDAQTRRAPNARIDYVEAKVKAKTNKTLIWLGKQKAEEQVKTIKYVVSRSREVANQKKEQQKVVEAEVRRRLKEKGRKKDATERRKVEKQVAELEKKAGQITMDQVLQLGPELPEAGRGLILSLLNRPGEVIGKTIMHTWFDEVKDSDLVYIGTVLKLKKRKKCTYVIAYHDDEEEPEEATDYDIARSQLVVDVLYGDLV